MSNWTKSDDPVEVRTPTTVSGTPPAPTSTVWPTGSTPLKSSDAVVAPSTAVAVWSLMSWLSMNRPWASERPRTVSQLAVEPCTVVVHVLEPATSSSEDEVIGATAFTSGASTWLERAATSDMVRVEALPRA